MNIQKRWLQVAIGCLIVYLAYRSGQEDMEWGIATCAFSIGLLLGWAQHSRFDK